MYSHKFPYEINTTGISFASMTTLDIYLFEQITNNISKQIRRRLTESSSFFKKFSLSHTFVHFFKNLLLNR